MRLNRRMEQLFRQYAMDPAGEYPNTPAYPIWRKTDASGRPYWGTGSFCGMDRCPIQPETNLSWLEWDGNEVYLSATDGCTIPMLLSQMMSILNNWRKEMGERYPDTSFYLTASCDDGLDAICDEDDPPIPSVTLRFWADRGAPPPADTENIEHYAQPVVMVYCKAKAGCGWL